MWSTENRSEALTPSKGKDGRLWKNNGIPKQRAFAELETAKKFTEADIDNVQRHGR